MSNAAVRTNVSGARQPGEVAASSSVHRRVRLRCCILGRHESAMFDCRNEAENTMGSVAAGNQANLSGAAQSER